MTGKEHLPAPAMSAMMNALLSSCPHVCIVISVILLIVIAILCYCIFYVPAKEGVSAAAYLRETFSTLFG